MNMKITNQLTRYYILFYALYSMTQRIIPISVFCVGPLAGILYKLIVAAGGCLALSYLILGFRRWRMNSVFFLLGGFIAVLCITTLLNHKYNLSDNILGVITFVIQLILFFSYYHMAEKVEFSFTIQLTAIVSSILWSICCFISLTQYVRNIQYHTLNSMGNTVRQGIMDGRLFGIFSDPNFAAFTSFLVLILLAYTFYCQKNMFLRIYISISILINVSYIVFSNSRTVFLSVIGTIFFFVLLMTYRHYIAKERTSIKRLILYAGRNLALTLIGLIAVYCLLFFPMQNIGKQIEPERSETDLVRDDVGGDNLTNNRSTIWINYLDLYKKKPVFGFSINSALPYATEHNPEGYLAKTQYVTHNGYLSLLVETGILGFLLMSAFLIIMFVRNLKRIQANDKISPDYTVALCLVVAVLIFLVCFHDVFFTVNIETMLLYLSMGVLFIETTPQIARSTLSTETR
ncbi:MAG: O-antigen ligase family protein [Eubacterium sp.]